MYRREDADPLIRKTSSLTSEHPGATYAGKRGWNCMRQFNDSQARNMEEIIYFTSQ